MGLARRIVVLSLATVAMAIAAAGNAAAAPPPNDTFANATTIGSLPFAVTVDTTDATVGDADDEVVAGCGFAGFPIGASVWYAYTPAHDQIVKVDASDSNYWTGVGVVTGAPGAFRPVACGTAGVTEFVVRAGRTYFIDISAPNKDGGELRLSVTGSPTPAGLDQSFTSPTSLSGGVYSCCDYAGQTFTVGRTGLLAAVTIDVRAGSGTTEPLHVAIRDLDANGLPADVVAETTIGRSSSSSSQPILFPTPPLLFAGRRYAILVNYVGDSPDELLGSWDGAIGDAYPDGTDIFTYNDGATWVNYEDQGYDAHFQTFVASVPTAKRSCTRGGWRRYKRGYERQPRFGGQAACVRFVNRVQSARGG